MKASRWLRDRPPVQAAVLLAFGARSLLGWLVAVPLIRTVGESGVLSYEEGDRLLFQPGALWLVELLYAESSPLWASIQSGLVLAVVGLIALSVPSALLYAVTLSPSWRLARALGRAAAALPAFVVIGALELLGLAVVLGASVSVALAVSTSTSGAGTESTRDLLSLATLAPGLLIAAVLAILADIARSAALASGPTLFQRMALHLRREVLLELISGYVFAVGAGCLTVAVAARLTELLRVDAPGGGRVLAVGLLHQLVLLGLVLLQLFWIRRVVAAAVQPNADRASVRPGNGEDGATPPLAS